MSERTFGILLGVIVAIVLIGGVLVYQLEMAKVEQPRIAPIFTSKTLSSTDLIVVHTEDASGNVVMPPKTMHLWEYVEGGDRANKAEMTAFLAALEADLHAKDTTFHQTHEFIDGKKW